MLKDPHQHQMDGFGRWEFLGLLGVILQGEARDVYTAFMKEWDPNLTYGKFEGRRVI